MQVASDNCAAGSLSAADSGRQIPATDAGSGSAAVTFTGSADFCAPANTEGAVTRGDSAEPMSSGTILILSFGR